MKEKPKPSYYAIIPASVRYDSRLPAGAKLLYGEVTALSNQKGYCFASNGYFSELYACTPQAISKWFRLLKLAGHVKISYSGEPGNSQRRVSIHVDSYQPQLRGVSTHVDGVSTTVDHNNTSISLQEIEREKPTLSPVPEQKTEIPAGPAIPPPPHSAAPPPPETFFAPDKHERAADEVIRYLEENRRYLNGMEDGDWHRAVRGHCLKLQSSGKWADLTIPGQDGLYFSWIGRRIAGAKSWFSAAAEIDKNGKNNRSNVPNTPPKTWNPDVARNVFLRLCAEDGLIPGEEPGL